MVSTTEVSVAKGGSEMGGGDMDRGGGVRHWLYIWRFQSVLVVCICFIYFKFSKEIERNGQ